MDAVFPSHNVSESLPKETTASPITLSNRISQEMYRLHRLVPLAKRINEKSYYATVSTSGKSDIPDYKLL